MAIPSSGSLALSAIQTEFGGSNPISMSEYYAGGSNVPSGTTDGDGNAVPSSGALAISDFYDTSASNYNEATGGTVTTSGNDKIHTFTSSGTFSVSAVSNVGSNTEKLEVLLVAGGGGGGSVPSHAGGGGGGGAGGVLHYDNTLTPQVADYTVTVGGGGGSVTNGSASSMSGTGISVSSTGGKGGNGVGGGSTGGASGGGTYGTSPSRASIAGQGNTEDMVEQDLNSQVEVVVAKDLKQRS